MKKKTREKLKIFMAIFIILIFIIGLLPAVFL
ncbi:MULTISPECIES: hypothetical protein [Clostridium]|uniref:DUF4044 domain-containing protein n=1 Tax=Clostridium aquiflavi TaxID=3073603 RepID=A0ABU1EF54_9CLOT|nr:MULTISPECIES: hypothetical protein [Clostridium]KAI3350934.1 DUF4044 domain-containing protein [Clostridium botulinum]MCR1130541.1 DUF4044 domain-containing protein [Clostridium botulinum]MCR1157004.1 DUF4044 domain-containing protein [Clostridium botulinum]MDR5586918.1 DUF4044 domain-containing protein [Clostridium sp. 5N-1]UZP04600.1 DUF4044 domain-containing protein [Clostridium botulinum]